MSEPKLSKLEEIIASFTAAERSEFHALLSTTSSAAARDQLKLFRLILYELDKQKSVENRDLFKKLYPGKRFDDKTIRYAKTELTRKAERFICLRELEEEIHVKDHLLSLALKKRSAAKAYSSHYNNVKNKQTASSPESYLYSYLQEYNHLEASRAMEKRGLNGNLGEVLNNLDFFFLSKKLQLSCEISNIRNVHSGDQQVLFLNDTLEFISKNIDRLSPYIVIYYKIFLTLNDPEKEEHFRQLRKLVKTNCDQFPPAELRDMYQYIMNYCIKKINLGNTGYQKILFETYKEALDNKALLPDGKISQWDFKNIVTISIREKEYKWGHSFIHEYKPFLKKCEQENAYTYNLAYWHFHNKDAGKALSLLRSVQFTDLYYQLDTRALLLKIYYEQDDLDALSYHLAAFRTFLKRNKLISPYQRTIYANLVKHTGKLASKGSDPESMKELKEEIETKKQVADIQWLLSKVNELI